MTAPPGGPVFRFKQVLTVGWEMNAFTGGLTYTFLSGYKNAYRAAGVPAPYNDNTVGKHGGFDLSFGYAGIKGLTLRAGILNVLDEDPPYSNQALRFQARAHDDRFYNPLGRTWPLGARYEF